MNYKKVHDRLYSKLSDYGNLNENIIDDLEKILELQVISKDEYLGKLYESKRKIGYVIDGLIRVYYLDEKGKEYNKNFFVKNTLFMTSLDNSEGLSVFFQSLVKSTVIIFDHDKYMRLSEKYPVLETILNKILIEYMYKKEQREISLLSLNSKDRYMKFMIENPILSKKLSQFHIASYLGITPTQLSRIKNQHM